MTREAGPADQASSGNAFAHLGLLDAGEELLKAQLTLRIRRTIRQRGLSRAQAAEPLERRRAADVGHAGDRCPVAGHRGRRTWCPA